MKLIGHRAAAGLALENTLKGITMAIKTGVDAIEFDLQQTADKEFVLSHDDRLDRISSSKFIIFEQPLSTLTRVRLNNGERLPGFDQAMEAIGDIPVIIDVKGTDWAESFIQALQRYPNRNVTVISFNHVELARFHELAPAIPTFAVEQIRPLQAIRTAKQQGFTGINLNFWILNPYVYSLAKRAGLQIIVYTINTPWLAHVIIKWFPDVTITTDTPDRLQFLRRQ